MPTRPPATASQNSRSVNDTFHSPLKDVSFTSPALYPSINISVLFISSDSVSKYSTPIFSFCLTPVRTFSHFGDTEKSAGMLPQPHHIPLGRPVTFRNYPVQFLDIPRRSIHHRQEPAHGVLPYQSLRIGRLLLRNEKKEPLPAPKNE